MKKRNRDREAVQAFLQTALSFDESRLWPEALQLALECTEAKSAVRQWPTLFEAVKRVVRHSRLPTMIEKEVRQWPEVLLTAAAKDKFFFMLK